MRIYVEENFVKNLSRAGLLNLRDWPRYVKGFQDTFLFQKGSLEMLTQIFHYPLVRDRLLARHTVADRSGWAKHGVHNE